MNAESADVYLRRPSLEYVQAFDLAMSVLHRNAGRSLALVSSIRHGLEVIKRSSKPVDFAGRGHFDAGRFVSDWSGWAAAPVAAVALDAAAGTYSTLVWAEPESAGVDQTANALRSLARRGALLVVIASAPLRRFLPEWKGKSLASRPVAPGAILWKLRKAGWQIETSLCFHGPRSIAWGQLGRAALAIGRSDWEDRCQFAIRAHYREKGWLWPLSPLSLIRARAI